MYVLYPVLSVVVVRLNLQLSYFALKAIKTKDLFNILEVSNRFPIYFRSLCFGGPETLRSRASQVSHCSLPAEGFLSAWFHMFSF